MFAGVLRFICTNSMIAGERCEEVRVPHKGGIPDQIIEGVYPSNADHASASSNRKRFEPSHRRLPPFPRFFIAGPFSGIFCAAIGGVRRS